MTRKILTRYYSIPAALPRLRTDPLVPTDHLGTGTYSIYLIIDINLLTQQVLISFQGFRSLNGVLNRVEIALAIVFPVFKTVPLRVLSFAFPYFAFSLVFFVLFCFI